MINSLRHNQSKSLTPGTVFEKKWGPLTSDMIKEYAKSTGTDYPIHTNDLIARILGLKGIIAHGLLSCGVITDFLEHIMEGHELIDCDYQMRGVIRPGDISTIKVMVKEICDDRVKFEISQLTKTKIALEKDGNIIRKYKAYRRNWITPKDKKKNLIKSEQIDDVKLLYRLKTTILGNVEYRLNKRRMH